MQTKAVVPFIDPAQTIKDLTDAVDYIKTHGWTQGKDFTPVGKCCAFGALRGVTGNDRNADVLNYERVSNASRAFYRIMGVDITTYNDVRGRTEFEVIRALETVADALRQDPSRA